MTTILELAQTTGLAPDVSPRDGAPSRIALSCREVHLSFGQTRCSLAVSVAGSLPERKRPFSLLRLTGMPLAHLRRVVVLEAVVPLVLVAIISAVAGLLAANLILGSFQGKVGLDMPGMSY